MFRRILIGIDGSDASLEAVAAAGRLASDLGGQVTLCYVVPPAPVFIDAAALALVEYERRADEEAKRLLREARDRLPPDLPVEERILHGSAAASLVDEASRGYDLLVVGSHGRGALQRFLLGSVATQVVANARTPVLVYRQRQVT